MKNLLFIFMFLNAMMFVISCEDEEEDNVTPEQKVTFTYERDGVKYDFSNNCYWFPNPDKGTPYYISGWKDDDNYFKITVPELVEKTWTEATDDHNTFYLETEKYGWPYYSHNGDTDCKVTITKYDKETGRLEGTFSGTMGQYDVYNDKMYYIKITNGKFIVDKD